MEEDGERDGLCTRGDSDGGRRRDQGTQETRGLRPVMGGKKAGDGFKPTGDGGKMEEGQSRGGYAVLQGIDAGVHIETEGRCGR